MRFLSLLVLLLSALVAVAQEPEHDPGDGRPAREAFLNFPESVALDRDGNVFVTERGGHRVRRIDARTGIITTIAGTGTAAFSGDGGPAAAAAINGPTGIAIDRAGNVFVGDTGNSRIRRIDASTGVITSIAGTGTSGWSGDGGPATSAKITAPFGLALDANENLFFTDTEVHRIRRIDRRSGIITTVAGDGQWAFGGDGGPATAASLARPHRILFDAQGNLVIGDSFNQRIRRVDARTGVIETIAGTGLRGSSGDGGPATSATFCYFGDLLFDARGDLIVSGVCDNRIRRIDMRSGMITAFAGSGRPGFDGEGAPFLEAGFDTPVGMARSRDGIVVADMRAHRIRRLDRATGTVITMAGEKSPRNPSIRWRFVYDREQFIREQAGPVPLRLPTMDAVTVQHDLRYATDALRRFDLYLPAGVSKPPVVVLVSGRNDTEVVPDEWGVFASRARLFAASGFAAVMFNHRLGLNGSIVQGAEDLSLLLQRLTANGDPLGIDTSRIAIVSWSMGSTTVAPLLPALPPNVRAIAAFYPYADLRELQTWQAPGKTEKNAARYSMTPAAVPALIVRAGKDAPLLRKGIDALIAESLRANMPLEIVNYPNEETGFDQKEATAIQRVIAFVNARL